MFELPSQEHENIIIPHRIVYPPNLHPQHKMTIFTSTAFAAPCVLPRSLIQPHPSSHSPSVPKMTATPSRRALLQTGLISAAALFLPTLPALARGNTAMTGEYKTDASLVLTDMRLACDLTRGAPGIADTVGRTRKEMNDFVALYRRNNKVSGSSSFSTLYTAINTLSGHYASYGSAYPVPDKRKKRLTQQFSEVDRALNRGR